MENYRPNSELNLVHRHKGVLPAIFASIGLETKISQNFEWLNAQIFHNSRHLLTLETLPAAYTKDQVLINQRFNSPLFKGLSLIKDQVAEMSESLEAAQVVHLVGEVLENNYSHAGLGIVIPFGDKERNVSKVINLIWADPKANSDLEQRTWELRNGDWAHTSTFAMKAMGINPRIVIG